VAQAQETLLFCGKNAFRVNSVYKVTSSVSLHRYAEYRLKHCVCVTSVAHEQ